MSPKHPPEDRNFDDLVQRFGKNIYQTMKGQLRLAVLRRDVDEFLPRDVALSVVDVGAGQGQWSLELTRMGHRVLLSDVSQNMLAQAQALFEQSNLAESALSRTRWLHAPLQQLPERVDERFDLVVCHAVLEWLTDPRAALPHLTAVLKPGGWLSLIYYNVHGLIFKNLLRTNYSKVKRADFSGARGSLTPLNPLYPEQVRDWLTHAGFVIECQSGIRVFHDYIFDADGRSRDKESVVDLELEFSRQLPYRDLGRYIHVLCRYEG